MNHLKRAFADFEIKIDEPIQYPIKDTRAITYSMEVEKVCKNRPQLVVVVTPNNKSDAYGAVKKITYVKIPTPCQVLTASLLKKPKGK